jgi:hypothetical protein
VVSDLAGTITNDTLGSSSSLLSELCTNHVVSTKLMINSFTAEYFLQKAQFTQKHFGTMPTSVGKSQVNSCNAVLPSANSLSLRVAAQ